MKKVLEGWLGGHYSDLSLHETKEESERGMVGFSTLDEDLRDFQEKKIRITVEVLKD